MEVGELITELLKCFCAALPSAAPSASPVRCWFGSGVFAVPVVGGVGGI